MEKIKILYKQNIENNYECLCSRNLMVFNPHLKLRQYVKFLWKKWWRKRDLNLGPSTFMADTLPSNTLLINFSPYLCTRLHYVHIYVTLLAVMAISQIKTSHLLITSFQKKKIIQSNWQKFNNNNFLHRCEKHATFLKD